MLLKHILIINFKYLYIYVRTRFDLDPEQE